MRIEVIGGNEAPCLTKPRSGRKLYIQWVFKGFSQVTGQSTISVLVFFNLSNLTVVPLVLEVIQVLTAAWLGAGEPPDASSISIFVCLEIQSWGGCRIPVTNGATLTGGGCKKASYLSSWSGGKVINVGACREKKSRSDSCETLDKKNTH